MARYRDPIDIIADVLKAASEGASKTKIMCRAKLNYKLLQKYLELATGNGFLQLNSLSYDLTDSGREFLDKYNSFNNRYSRVWGSLEKMNRERVALKRLCRKI